MRILAAILILAAPALAQTKAPPPAGHKPVTPAQRARLMALLPDAAVVSAQPSGPSVSYTDDLHKYLDGGADAYRIGGMAAMLHQEYEGSGARFMVDIYDMSDGARAFRIYSIERPPECSAVKIGREAYVDEGLLNFSDGQYYVKLSAIGEPGKTAAQLETFARSISARIASAPTGAGKK